MPLVALAARDPGAHSASMTRIQALEAGADVVLQEGSVLKQPYGLRRAGLKDRSHARLHGLDRRLVRDRLVTRQPFDHRQGGFLRLKRKDGRIGQGQPRNTLTAQT
jgi:hypothetical protein